MDVNISSYYVHTFNLGIILMDHVSWHGLLSLYTLQTGLIQREEKLAVYHKVQKLASYLISVTELYDVAFLLCRLDKQLAEVEKRHKLSCHWSQAHSDYKQLSMNYPERRGRLYGLLPVGGSFF